MFLDILRIKISNEHVGRRDIPKVRGFVAGENLHVLELHNHFEDEKFNYGYPLIQYKSISGEPYMMAISPDVGKKLIEVVCGLNGINIGNKVICTNEKAFFVEKKEFGCNPDLVTYKFITPWMALNQANYRDYAEEDDDFKNNLLKKILIGNVLSMSKKLKYTVNEELKVYLKLNPQKANFKSNEMIVFNGEFMINFNIPDFFGIGKSVSRGYGTVKRIEVGQFV